VGIEERRETAKLRVAMRREHAVAMFPVKLDLLYHGWHALGISAISPSQEEPRPIPLIKGFASLYS
jgi:hypothetical protein